MRNQTLYLPHISGPVYQAPGFEPVAGIRVMGHRPIHWFNKLVDAYGRLKIGRTRKRSIQLDDRSVSCLHAEIQRVERGLYFLRDLGSVNGVKVRRRGHYGAWERQPKGAKVLLEPGIHIKLGRVIIVPVDADGKCPVNVRDHVELARHSEDVYGSASAVAGIVGRSRQWIRDAILGKIGGK